MELIVFPSKAGTWKQANRAANLFLAFGFKVRWALEPFACVEDGKRIEFPAGSFVLPGQDLIETQKIARTIGMSLRGFKQITRFKSVTLSLPRVSLFSDAGSPFPFVSSLSESGFDFEPISSREIRKGKLRSYDVLIIPGGGDKGPPEQSRALGKTGRQKVRDFLRLGGSVWGSCAGSCNLIHYSRDAIPWKLNYDNWENVQSLNVINCDYWSRGMSGVGNILVSNENEPHPVMFGLPREFLMTWHLGPFLSKSKEKTPLASDAPVPLVKPIALTRKWTPAEELNSKKTGSMENYADRAIRAGSYGIVVGDYGTGKVLASGGHPEFGLDLLLERKGPAEQMISNFLFWASKSQVSKERVRKTRSKIPRKSIFDSIERATRTIEREIYRLRKNSKQFPNPRWLDAKFAASTFGKSAKHRWPIILNRLSKLPEEIRNESLQLKIAFKKLHAERNKTRASDPKFARLLKKLNQISSLWEIRTVDCLTYEPSADQDYGWQGVRALLGSALERLKHARERYEMDPSQEKGSSPHDLIWDYYLGALFDLVNSKELLRARNTLAHDLLGIFSLFPDLA